MSNLSATKFGSNGVNIRDDHFVFATHRFRGIELFFGDVDVPIGIWVCGFVCNKIWPQGITFNDAYPPSCLIVKKWLGDLDKTLCL